MTSVDGSGGWAMGGKAVQGGGRRWRAVGGIVMASGAVAAFNLHRPPPPSTAFDRPDVHAEYGKDVSGRDTITGYLAKPERKDPAPAAVAINENFGMSDLSRQT